MLFTLGGVFARGDGGFGAALGTVPAPHVLSSLVAFTLLGCQLLQVDAVEIDRFEQQRRETGVLHRRGNDLARERE